MRRIYYLLLRLLPSEFRGDFAEAMAADLDQHGDRGVGFWWREILSLLRTIMREHLDALRYDLKYAFRMMRRTPGFTTMAVLMLALGTGVNVAMFSIVDAVMLRSPFEEPEELVGVGYVANGRPSFAMPLGRFQELATMSGPLIAVAAQTGGLHVLTGPGDPQNIDDIECVSWQMFDVLRSRPMLGRTFGPGDDRPGAEPTIVLANAFWRQLGGRRDIVGTPLTINQTRVTVVGVMPRGFSGSLAVSDVQGWMPIGRPVKSADNAGCRQGLVNVMGRLQPGLSVEANQSAIAGFALRPLVSPGMEDVQTPFTVLMAAVACVLLIACFNVGGLQMERTLARRREMALRLALGASRSRLARQTLTENVVLSLLGAVTGVLAAAFTLRFLVSMLPENVPYLEQVEVNGRVLTAAIGAAIGVGLVAGLLPIGETRKVTPARDLVDATRASERRGSWGRRALVVAEIALSIVVLIGAALMIQTFLTLRPTRPGFDFDRKVVLPLRLRGATPDVAEQTFTQVFERLRTARAIRAAEGTTSFPMSGITDVAELQIGGAMRSIWTNEVTPGFFALMKMPIVAGRAFLDTDTRASMPVVIVNQVLAARLRPDSQVIGQQILVKVEEGLMADAAVPRTIVGIVGNTRSSGVHTRFREEAFLPYAQNPAVALQIVVEVEPGQDAEAVVQLRHAVRQVRPDLVSRSPELMSQWIRQRMGATPFGAWLLGVIAVLAVGLAAIGLMTTIGWWVRQRTRELGVRVALGASRAGVTGLVLRQGMTLAVIGVALGCAVAASVTRYLTGWIYGVTPLDPGTFIGAAFGMLIVAAIAVYVPVRRATALDPVVALRAE